jgi:hypothetical protein
MAMSSHKRLPGSEYDIWLIESSRESLTRSRDLLERTKPLIAIYNFGPFMPHVCKCKKTNLK